MIGLQIDIRALLPALQREADVRMDAVEEMLVDMGDFAKGALIERAKTQLSAESAAVFEEALNQPSSIKVTKGRVVVTLIGDQANALENGAGPYDLKVMLNGPSAKQGKDGSTYVDVPFTGSQSASKAKAALQKGQAKFSGKKTIKRMSTNSPDSSWIHPGFEGAGIFDDVRKDVLKELDKRLEDLGK